MGDIPLPTGLQIAAVIGTVLAFFTMAILGKRMRLGQGDSEDDNEALRLRALLDEQRLRAEIYAELDRRTREIYVEIDRRARELRDSIHRRYDELEQRL